MSELTRPSLSELITAARNEVAARMGDAEPLQISDANVYATVLAGMLHGLYGFVEQAQKQILEDSSSLAFLERQGNLRGITRKPAEFAVGSVEFLLVSGAIDVPIGTLVKAINGQEYETTTSPVTVGTTATVMVEATVAGASGNRAAGELLTLVSPLAGVISATSLEISGGADIESEDDYRARVIQRKQQTPQGGCAYDYSEWAKSVPGVTRAWTYPHEMAAGCVTVRFVRDNDAVIFPDANEIFAVQNYLDSVRPVAGTLYVVSPVAQPLNFTISGLTPATTAVKAAVEQELRDLIFRESEPGKTLLISHIRAAVSAAANEYDHAIVSPAANVAASSVGHMITFGAITWT